MKKTNLVLYISYDGMTDPLGQSQVIPYLQGLSKFGYQFTIISFEKKDRLKKNGEYIRSLLDASGIKWEPQLFSHGAGVFSKLYDLWQIKRTALRLYKKEKFSLVHCRSYVAAEAGLLLNRKFSIPYLFDMRGFWVDERLDNGQWSLKNPLHRFYYRIYKKKEERFLKKAFHIISLTSKGKEELVNAYHVPAGKITVIPCCVDLDHFNYKKIEPAAIAEKKKLLKIREGDKVLSYLGSFGGWYLLNEMFVFYIELKKKIPELKFLFITPSPPSSVINTVTACGADPRDVIIQAASRLEVPLYLALSDWSVFFIKEGYSKVASSPTKQGEIMAMGIPIICNNVGDTGKIIEDSGAGLVIHGFSQEECSRISEHVQGLLHVDKENIRQSAVEYFDLKKGTEKYQEVYKRVLE